MKLALNWLADSGHTGTVLISTDSQAVLRAIGSCSESVSDLVSILGKPQLSRTILQWVPGHCSIPGNELADQKAKEASRLDTMTTTVSLPSAVSNRTFSIRKHNTLGRLQFMLTTVNNEIGARLHPGKMPYY